MTNQSRKFQRGNRRRKFSFMSWYPARSIGGAGRPRSYIREVSPPMALDSLRSEICPACGESKGGAKIPLLQMFLLASDAAERASLPAHGQRLRAGPA